MTQLPGVRVCDMLQLVALTWEESSRTFSDKLKHIAHSHSRELSLFNDAGDWAGGAGVESFRHATGEVSEPASFDR